MKTWRCLTSLSLLSLLLLTSGCASAKLRAASIRGDLGEVRSLLSFGADVNVRGSNGMTALHGAASNGHQEIVRLLLERNANVDATAPYGVTPLCLAVSKGHLDVVTLLLAHEADVDATAQFGVTPLMTAAQDGHLDMVNLLLAHQAAVNAAASDGATALLLATASGHTEIVRALVKAGADVNAKTHDGHTPLAIAREGSDIAECLIHRLDGIAWTAAEREDSGKAYAHYLATNPDGEHSRTALERLDELAWATVTNAEFTVKTYREYISHFPKGRHAPEATDCLAWADAERTTTVEAFQKYMDMFPEGRFVDTARENIDVLRGTALVDEGHTQCLEWCAKTIVDQGAQFLANAMHMGAVVSTREHPFRVAFAQSRADRDDFSSYQPKHGTVRIHGEWRGVDIQVTTVTRPDQRPKNDSGLVFIPQGEVMFSLTGGRIVFEGRLECENRVVELLSGAVVSIGRNMSAVVTDAPEDDSEVIEYTEGTKCRVDGVTLTYEGGQWERSITTLFQQGKD